MIFARLGSLIARRYKVIIPLWIIILVLSTPFIIQSSSKLSQQQGATSATNLESDKAQAILNSQFRSSSSLQSVLLVVSSANVTSPETRGYVSSLASQLKADPALPDLVSVATVYSSVTALLNGTVATDQQLKNGTEIFAQLFFGVPALFVNVWTTQFGSDPAQVQAAASATSTLLAQQSGGGATTSQQYLSLFASVFSASLQASPTTPLGETVQSSIAAAGSQFLGALPASSAQLAGGVLQRFSVANYSSPAAIEAFVVSSVPQVSLFSAEMAKAAYPVATGGASLAGLVDSVVANPNAFAVPAVYSGAVTSFVSPDHTLMIVSIAMTNVTSADLSEIRSVASSTASSLAYSGSVRVTGQQALQDELTSTELGDTAVILPVTLILLIVATAIFFRSVLTPFLSLGTIGVALGISQAMIVFVATYLTPVDATTPTILLTIIMGVGTDYSVFLLARYREERVRGRSAEEGLVNTVAWAGESIATSGMTVIVSFVFLGFQSVTFLKSLGSVVGLGVLIALAAALTLVPSLIMLVPDRVFFPNSGARFGRYAARVKHSLDNRTGYFSKSGRFSIKHAKVIVVVALVATVPAAYTWGTLNPSYDFLSSAPKSLPSVSAFTAISDSFGAGTVFPTYVVLQFTHPLINGSSFDTAELAVVDAASNLTLANPQVLDVAGPTRPGGGRVDFYSLGTDQRSALISSDIRNSIGNDSTYAVLTVTLKGSPYTQASLTAAQDLRNAYKTLAQNDSQYLVTTYLGGAAGSTLDSSVVVNSEFAQVIAYVTAAVAVILLVVLGSLFLPAFAIVSIVMSIAWTLATAKVLFGTLYNFQILFITPLTLFVLLLGLGMDYNIFILTRIREEASKGKELDEAIVTAIENTGGIISAAAVILAGSLGALMLSSSLLLKEFGFAFFFSILVDAMVMRTYVVPAVMSLMGKWNWYAPGPLQRVKIKRREG